MANYSFVIDSSFKPFSMQEMLVPFEYYKDAYDKADEQYNELQDKSDAFKYLSETLPEDSKARQIYEGYANGLREQAEDFAQNGLSMANRRALSSYRKRYAGEIGRLSKADEALQKEIDRRTALNANDPTTLYATDNLSIDDFLDRKRPNDYSVSGDKLYQRGVQIGASDSSRIWSNPNVVNVNKYYQSIYQSNGRDPRILAEWRNKLESIPELNESLNATLKEFGVTDNLTGANYERAKESVINGIINGSTYKRNDNIQRDLSQMSAYENAGINVQQQQVDVSRDELKLKQEQAHQDDWLYNIDPKTGKRTGLSEAGKEYMMNYGSSSKSSSTSKKSTKTQKHNLKDSTYYSDGKAYRAGGQNTSSGGEEITYSDAVNIDPSIAKHDPGYADNYRYYKKGSTIFVEPIGTSVDDSNDDDNNDHTNDGDQS